MKNYQTNPFTEARRREPPDTTPTYFENANIPINRNQNFLTE